MIRDDYYRHIEYLNPRLHTKTLVDRIGVMIIAPSVFISIMSVLFIVVQRGNREFILLAMMLGPVLGIPLFWIMKDCIGFFVSPLKSYKALAKVVMSRRSVAIVVGKTLMQELKWEDIKIIEKTRRDGAIVILLITNPFEDKCVICEDKKKNFIQIPARSTLIKAVERFSGKKIEIADPDFNRFIKG